jgi:hypothetical protein
MATVCSRVDLVRVWRPSAWRGPLILVVSLALLGACANPVQETRSPPTSPRSATASPSLTPFRPPPGTRAWLPLDNPYQLGSIAGDLYVLTRGWPDQPGGSLLRADASGTTLASHPVSFDPWDMTVGLDGVWVTPNGADANVVRFDPRSLAEVARVGGIPTQAMGPYLTAGLGRIWVANSDERSVGGGTTVSEVDPRTNRAVIVRVGLSPQSIVTGFGSVWTGNHDEGTVTRFDPVSHRTLATVPIKAAPHSLAAGAGGIFVGLPHDDKLLKIDPETNAVTWTLDVDLAPGPMVTPPDGRLWVAASPFVGNGDDRILVIDGRSQAIVRAIHLGGKPAAMTVIGNTVWVAIRGPDGLLALSIEDS